MLQPTRCLKQNFYPRQRLSISFFSPLEFRSPQIIRIWCLMIWGRADVIIIEIKCTINVMHLNNHKIIHHSLTHGKFVFHKTGPWCPKGLGTAVPFPLVPFSSGYLEGLDYLPKKAKWMLSVISTYGNSKDSNIYFKQLDLCIIDKSIPFRAIHPVVTCTGSALKVWSRKGLWSLCCMLGELLHSSVKCGNLRTRLHVFAMHTKLGVW